MIERPRIPGQDSRVVVGVDWGATTGIACLVLATGQSLGTCLVERPAAHKARPGKPATKKRPAVEAVPALETWQAWAQYSALLTVRLVGILEPGDIVAIEDPGGHMLRDSWLSHGRSRTVCEMLAMRAGASLVLVPTGRVKIQATGHGRAEKEEMIGAARARWDIAGALYSEHEADALWIAETARRGAE